MASRYQVVKGTKISVTKEPFKEDQAEPEYVELGCMFTEMSYTGGAKADIDVTTLCSTSKENTNGLPDPGEVSFTGNWVVCDEAIQVLRQAYNDDQVYGFKMEMFDADGNPAGGYEFQGQVRQENFTITAGDVMKGGFTVRMRGLMTEIGCSSGS